MEKDWRPKASDNQFEKIAVEKPAAIPTKLSHRMDDAPVFENDEPASRPVASKIKYIGLACLGVVVLVLLVFLGTRAVTGYAVYGAMQQSGIPNEYATNMIGLQTELNQAKEAIADTTSSLEQARAAKESATEQVSLLATENDALSQKLSETEVTAASLESERDEARTALQESARQLCCVQRVLNPEINSYGLVDGVVVCGEDRTVSISC